MTHYPYRTDLSDEFGIAPHTDTSLGPCSPPMEFTVCRYARKPANGSMRRPFPAPLQSTAAICCNAGPTIIPAHPASHRQPLGCRPLRAGLLLRRRYRLADRRRADPHQADKSPKYLTTRYTEYMIDYKQRTYNIHVRLRRPGTPQGASRGAGWRIVGSGRAAARTHPSVARRMHETPLSVAIELVKG